MKDIIKNYFDEVKFTNSSHSYTLGGRQKLSISVSGLVKKFTRQVDFNNIASKIDSRLGLPAGVMSKMWKLKSTQACVKGDRAHYFGEIYAFHRSLKPTSKLEEAIKDYWDSLPSHIEVVFVELVMYHKKFLFGGMSDIILYNTKTKTYIIADYKTNEELFKNFAGKKLLPPFDNLLDNNFNKYQIQLNFYQILLEQVPNIKVSERQILWVKESGVEVFNTKDYMSELKSYLNNHGIK